MATLNETTMSMVDKYKSQDGYGRYIDTIEVLNDTSQGILDDWSWMPCNSGTKHTRSIRTGLPSTSWGALYEGIPQSKASKQTVDDTTGFIESLCTVDKRLIELYGDNAALLRNSEAEAHIEAMAQDLLTSMFYFDTATNARHPKGLGARYGALATSGAGNQIVDGGGTGSDNTSIWFVEWGYEGVSVIYPGETPAGMQRKNKGEQRALDANGNPYYVEEEMFSAHVGFSIGDWQRVSVIRNIDVSDLNAGSVELFPLMRKAWYKLKSRRVNKIMNQASPGRLAIYCNRDVLEALDAEQDNQRGSGDNFRRLGRSEIEGREVDTYRNIPIRETDAILNTEAQVT